MYSVSKYTVMHEILFAIIFMPVNCVGMLTNGEHIHVPVIVDVRW